MGRTVPKPTGREMLRRTDRYTGRDSLLRRTNRGPRYRERDRGGLECPKRPGKMSETALNTLKLYIYLNITGLAN